MTNEEKAREILKANFTGNKEEYLSLKEDLLEMAEWKDQQYADIIKEECNASYESGLAEEERKAEVRFKEYLEKKLETIRDCYQKSKTEYKKDYHSTQMVVIAEIINELFKGE